MNFGSSSSGETKKFAANLAKEILASPQKRGATVLALQGDLGAGKTTFAQGFLRGLGIKEKTASPTFIIMREFSLRHKHFHRVYHIDAYRIVAREASVLNLKKIFRDPYNIVLIEWAENIKKLIPKTGIKIHMSHGKESNERLISIEKSIYPSQYI